MLENKDKPKTTTSKAQLVARFNTICKSIDDYVSEIARHNRYRTYTSVYNDNMIDDRSRLIDLYEMAITQDAHMRSVIETLESQIMGDVYSIGKLDENGDFQADPHITEKIRGNSFDTAIRGIMEAKLYGYTLLEIMPDVDPYSNKLSHIKVVERRNVLPNQNTVLLRAGDAGSKKWNVTSKSLSDYYVMINTGELGLFSTTVPLVIAKKFTFGNYVNFAHTYGLPIIHGKSNSAEINDKQELADSIADAVDDRIVVTGLEDVIDIKAAAVSNSERIYVGLIDGVNRDISNVVLGSESMAGATQSYTGSTRAHQDIFRDRINVYKRFVENVMNEQIIPRLIKFGYLEEGCVFRYSKRLDMSTEDKVKVMSMLLPNYDIDEGEISSEFGLTVTKKDFGGSGSSTRAIGTEDDTGKMTDAEYQKRYGKPRDVDSKIKKMANYLVKNS